ncbi:MAG: hypothetical protein LBN11_08250, partial [Tannerella sp.]|nr:hypothetical protein [Tannerella sp.]
MKKFIIILLAFVALIVVIRLIKEAFFSPSPPPPISFVDYTPIEEFKPAYEALTIKSVQSSEPVLSKDSTSEIVSKTGYDIEETVRIINGLEIAQSQSDDFYGFLEYMAKQDYSQVAGDVIEAKMKLLPIFQQMFKLQKEHKELSKIYNIMRHTVTTMGKAAAGTTEELVTMGTAIAEKDVAVAIGKGVEAT